MIPEAWFEKQSSFTGQETFFPKEQILARIAAIQRMKDDYSLEEMARILSPENAAVMAARDLGKVDGLHPAIIGALENSGLFLRVRDIGFLEMMSDTENQALTEAQICRLLEQALPVLRAEDDNDLDCVIFSVGDTVCAAFSRDTRMKLDNGATILKKEMLTDRAADLTAKYAHLLTI